MVAAMGIFGDIDDLGGGKKPSDPAPEEPNRYPVLRQPQEEPQETSAPVEDAAVEETTPLASSAPAAPAFSDVSDAVLVDPNAPLLVDDTPVPWWKRKPFLLTGCGVAGLLLAAIIFGGHSPAPVTKEPTYAPVVTTGETTTTTTATTTTTSGPATVPSAPASGPDSETQANSELDSAQSAVQAMAAKQKLPSDATSLARLLAARLNLAVVPASLHEKDVLSVDTTGSVVFLTYMLQDGTQYFRDVILGGGK